MERTRGPGVLSEIDDLGEEKEEREKERYNVEQSRDQRMQMVWPLIWSRLLLEGLKLKEK